MHDQFVLYLGIIRPFWYKQRQHFNGYFNLSCLVKLIKAFEVNNRMVMTIWLRKIKNLITKETTGRFFFGKQPSVIINFRTIYVIGVWKLLLFSVTILTGP
jgi:hypothetical protein